MLVMVRWYEWEGALFACMGRQNDPAGAEFLGWSVMPKIESANLILDLCQAQREELDLN